MSGLTEKKCLPCEGGVPPLPRAECERLLAELSPEWRISPDGAELQREFAVKDIYRTRSFGNALAHVANSEDHHPDIAVGYGYCRVRYSTHAVGGLTENDFICAAKIDRIG
ncbi:MAG: 4a-hydroxytetrahydrobiopterin dehydratase [Gammaproteobacteria bacterium]